MGISQQPLSVPVKHPFSLLFVHTMSRASTDYFYGLAMTMLDSDDQQHQRQGCAILYVITGRYQEDTESALMALEDRLSHQQREAPLREPMPWVEVVKWDDMTPSEKRLIKREENRLRRKRAQKRAQKTVSAESNMRYQ